MKPSDADMKKARESIKHHRFTPEPVACIAQALADAHAEGVREAAKICDVPHITRNYTQLEQLECKHVRWFWADVNRTTGTHGDFDEICCECRIWKRNLKQ